MPRRPRKRLKRRRKQQPEEEDKDDEEEEATMRRSRADQRHPSMIRDSMMVVSFFLRLSRTARVT